MKIDIYKITKPFLPEKGLMLPNYRYCGPGNPLDNGKPINKLDAICQKHDHCYENQNKCKCDQQMLLDLQSYTPTTKSEKQDKAIVSGIINLKQKLNHEG